MPTLTVVAGDTFTKQVDWDEIKVVKDDLKQFFKWDPKSKAWVLRPIHRDDIEAAAVLVAKVFDKDSSQIIKVIAKAVEEENASKKKKLLQELETLLDEGTFATVPLRRLSEDQWKLAMKVFKWENKKLVLRIDRVANWVVENEISEVKFVPELLRFMNSLGLTYGDRHIEYLNEIKKLVFEEAEKYRMLKDSILLEDSGEDVIVRFGRRLDPVERKILYDELSTVYFTTDKNGDLIEHTMRVIHYDKTLGVYRIPYFAVDHLYEACKKLKFKAIIDRVGWVKKDIPKPDFKLKLYPFQEEAVRAWLKNNCKGVVVVPTGGGKTIIALAALQLIHVPTLICVPTIELARQWRNTIRKVLGVDAGILGGGSKDIRPITVAIYNSAVNEITKLKDKFDFVIFDECHHVPAETFRKVAFNIKARKRLGLSATPQRTDRNEALIFFSVGKMVYKAVYAELVKLKLASPLIFKTILVPLTDKEYDEYLKASDEEGNRVQKRMKIALMASKKYLVLGKLLEEHSDAKTLIFTQYVDQAKQAYKVAKKVLGRDRVALIMGNTPAKERDSAFEKFKNGEVTCLVSTTVLDEGVDVPDAEVAIILSGSSTERQLIQRIGRVIRYYPGKVAKVYEIVAQGTIEEKHATRRRAVLRDYRIEVEA